METIYVMNLLYEEWSDRIKCMLLHSGGLSLRGSYVLHLRGARRCECWKAQAAHVAVTKAAIRRRLGTHHPVKLP